MMKALPRSSELNVLGRAQTTRVCCDCNINARSRNPCAGPHQHLAPTGRAESADACDICCSVVQLELRIMSVICNYCFFIAMSGEVRACIDNVEFMTWVWSVCYAPEFL